MTISTNMVSGLASGFDWRTMIDQLIAVDHRRVDLVEDEKSETEKKLSEWQSFNTKLLALKTAAEGLKDPEDFAVYTSRMLTDSAIYDTDDLLSVTTDTDASPGSYEIEIKNLAKAQKLSSNPFTSQSDALGSNYAGEIVINGEVITIAAADTLADVASSINNANSGTDPSGVTANIVSYGDNDHRLILTSDDTGEDGISLLNGSSTNLVQKFGWKDNGSTSVKNSITQGAQSDRFTSQNVVIKSLLGLSTGEASSGALTIDGTGVTIDLGNDSLTEIKDAINTAMTGAGKGSTIVASIVSETVDSITFYRIQVEGTQTFVDENNILNTLGILDHTSSSVSGEVSGNAMTTDGANITPDTLLVNIDGYISYTAGDKITMTGSDVSSSPIASHDFSITATSTVQDLLDDVEDQYSVNAGDVIAYVTSDGKIRVDDVAGGGGLSITLTDSITNGQLEFVDSDAAFGDSSARSREIVAGEDALIEVDGVEVTDASNTIEDVITGVTLNLLQEEVGSTVTLDISRDIGSIKSNISNFVSSYNSIMSYINTQFSYDADEGKTGGIMFGDGTLRSVKSNVISLVSEAVWGVDSDYSSMGLVGIEANKEMILSIDDAILNGYLQTNFNDVMALFVGQGTTSNTTLSYIGHDRESIAGEYTVHIDRVATQGTETGNVDLSAGGAGETLTITQGDSTASVTITSGMTLDDITNEINEELDTEYTETLAGDQLLLEGASAITASTEWGNITGNSLVDGDTVTFSGTTRNGSAISGNYTISAVATDSVQGFLSAVESAFSSDVSASIDSSGRFVLTDKFSGTSEISIDITEPAGRGLDFGTVDITAAAGDGSQEGRYKIAVTAADDGSNHLVLENDSYGSSAFTISQDTSDSNYNHILYSDTGNTTEESEGTVDITDSTKWTEIYGADVTNNDTITITGMARDGSTPINGTYTAIDVGTDTVGGLLTAIESAYTAQGTSVDAFIKDGKIYVEDQTAGSSSITLTLTANNQGGGSLDLGDGIDQITQRDLDLGLINGTVTGLDVAGTINGESATGSGQVLAGDEDNVNTEGLSVRYSGSSDNADAGTVQLTLGVAELYDRVLYNMTDIIDGYVTFKQDSLQNNITRYETKIEEMEARLDIKMETLIKRFVQMELALSRIQNQSDWLASQLSAASSGWR